MSAVITLLIVVMWAVVLVPMWLRRHDRVNELASVDRFAGAMRVLSRRTAGRPDRRYVVMPERPARRDAAVASVKAPPHAGRAGRWHRSARRPGESEPSAASTGLRTVRPAPSRSVRRRRRTLVTLVAAVVISAVALVVRGPSLLWVQVACDVVLLAGLARTRSMVAAERRRRAQRVTRLRRASVLRSRLADLPPGGRGPGRTTRSTSPAPDLPGPDLLEDGEDIVVFTSGTPRPQGEQLLATAEALAGQPEPAFSAANPSTGGDQPAGGSWVASGPAPTPREERPPREQRLPPEPTARAEAVGLPEDADTGEIPVVRVSANAPTRVLDLTRPGAWAEGRLIDDDPEVVAKAADAAEELDLDRIIGRRRAVND